MKRDLTFGEENEEFQDVMRRAWETFTADRFHENVDRFGVALGLYSKKIDEHYTTVLTWARNATTAADFLARIAAPRLASQTQRTFLALVRTMLERAAGRAITDDELWRFCRSLVRPAPLRFADRRLARRRAASVDTPARTQHRCCAAGA